MDQIQFTLLLLSCCIFTVNYRAALLFKIDAVILKISNKVSQWKDMLPTVGSLTGHIDGTTT